jgi:class 3 adenylate cyclase
MRDRGGSVVRELPTGTVTFFFADVEGSTRLLHDLGPDEYAKALMERRRVLRDASTRTAVSRWTRNENAEEALEIGEQHGDEMVDGGIDIGDGAA